MTMTKSVLYLLVSCASDFASPTGEKPKHLPYFLYFGLPQHDFKSTKWLIGIGIYVC